MEALEDQSDEARELRSRVYRLEPSTGGNSQLEVGRAPSPIGGTTFEDEVCWDDCHGESPTLDPLAPNASYLHNTQKTRPLRPSALYG